jgi:transcriptional regulator PpsR
MWTNPVSSDWDRRIGDYGLPGQRTRRREIMANVTSQPDVTLLLDLDGVIREVAFSRAIKDENSQAWLGRPWVETVEDPGSANIRRMVDDARASGISAFRQVTQRFPSGLELPMEYTTVLLGARAGLLAIGKSLQAVAELQSRLIAAQQTLERDYWRLREVETRYRLVFDASNDAVVLLKASNLRIVEANPAAVQALGLTAQSRDDVAGRELLPELDRAERDSVQTMLLRVREQGKAPGMILHLGRDRKPWTVRATLMTSEPGPVFLLQLAPAGMVQPAAGRNNAVSIEELMEKAPDAFAVIDPDGIIKWANRAFLDLVEVGSKASVIGERLARWLRRPGADVAVLLAHLQRNQMVRLFSTAIHSELGTDTEVEISASGHVDADPRLIGMLLRDVSRRLQVANGSDRLRESLGSISEQVGKTPLRKLVRNTVSVVEQHYVKAALELANGNRTAAAEILGLSRQSLYAKLNRYGLEGDAAAVPADSD